MIKNNNLNKYNSLIKFIRKIYKTKSKIQLHPPYLNGNEKKYLNSAIDSNFVSTSGEFISKFENKFAKFVGLKHAIAVVNGTSALQIALILNECKNNTQVITQSLSFVATSNAIKYCGAEPLFIDVDKKTMGLSAKKLENYLENNCEVKNNKYCLNKKTKKIISACLPMHTYGYPLEIDKIYKLCKKFKIKLIEDCAESLGSFYNSKHTGNFGNVACFSFNGNKIITTGGGGMIVTNDSRIARKARHIISTSKLKHKWEFNHDEIGYNYRMPNINAALGLAQIEQIKKNIKTKEGIYLKYLNFCKKNNFKIFNPIEKTIPNYWLNILIAKNIKERNHILNSTHKNNIFTRPAWKLLHTLPMFKKCQKENLSNSKWLADRIICLPSGIINE